MPAFAKFLLGVAAVLLMTWLSHGPLGNGAALADGLELQARAAVAGTGVPGVTVGLDRNPISRRATLAGTADPFQREGQGSLKGLNDVVGEIDGISAVGWADTPNGARSLPLLVETMLLAVAAYLAGLAISWLLFGRPKRDSYL